MCDIKVVPLGAGQDVGRSCILVTIQGRNIMLDCGIHMGYNDERRFPDFNFIATTGPYTEHIDCIIISHFHLDHCGALPYFTEVMGYSGPIYMTKPTKAICPILLEDYAKIGERKAGKMLFDSEMINQCMKKVITVGLHQTVRIDKDFEIKAYYAGHVLGAAMFYIRVGLQSVVYTGDYNMTPDRHLGAAWIDKCKPDLLITESTYGTTIRDSKRCRERDFLKKIHDTVERGGKVLIPVFALGRAQELCILLETFWDRMNLQAPIYFSAGMTEKANYYYKLFISWTNEKIKKTYDKRNMFEFNHIKPFDKSYLDLPGPMVIFATPGMLHAGASLQVFKRLAEDDKNMVIIPGYCVQGTVGNRILSGQKEVEIDHKLVKATYLMDQIDIDIDADLSNNDKPIRLKKLVNLNQLQHGVNYEVSDLEYDDNSTTTITTNDNNNHDNCNRSNNNTYNYTNTYFDGEDLFRNINSECTMTPGDDDDANNSNDNIDPNLSPFERLALSMEPLTEDRQILKRVLRVGVGELMPEGALYRVHYNAYLEYSGEPYDSTRLRKKVCQLRLGVSAIPGWDISLMTMRKDELSKFLVSHEYAYGKMGCPPRIPPEATLLFEIELLSWVDYAAADSYNILTSEEKKLRSFQELLEVVHGERALGNDFFKSKNYQRALRNYSKAIHLLESIDLMNEQEEITWKKEMVRLRLNMAFVNLKLANSRTAIRYCKDVQDYDKNNVKAVYRIGQAYKQLGEFDKAKESFLRAVHLAPKNADIRHELEELENDAKIHLERKKKICQKIFKTESFPKRDTNALLSSLAVPEDFISEIKISFEAFLQDDSVQHLDLPPVLRENERLAVKYLAEEHDLIVTLPDFRKQKSVKVSKKHLFM